MRILIENFIYRELAEYFNMEEFSTGDVSYLTDKIFELFEELKELEENKEPASGGSSELEGNDQSQS